MQYILIHGYGTKVEYPKLFGLNLANPAGFGAFESMLRQKQAVLFEWFIPAGFTWLDFLNPYQHLNLYHQEQQKAYQSRTQQRLSQLILASRPQAIICHSMGSELLLAYLQHYRLPSSVKSIICIQSNLKSLAIPGSIQKKIALGKLRLVNFFCPWDQALWSLAMLKGYIPVGLFGSSSKYVENVLFPLYRTWNLHTSSINDPAILPKLAAYNS